MPLKDAGKRLIAFYEKRYRELAGYRDPKPYPSLYEMMDELYALPEYVFSRYGFKREILRDRFTDKERDELLFRCMQTGKELAEEVRKRFSSNKPSEIAKRLGMKIVRPDIPTGGGRVLFAEFAEPDEIRIYQHAVRNARKAIEENHLEKFFTDVGLIEEVLIAHELFHWVEMEKKDTIFTRNFQRTIWHIGKFCYKSHVVSLSEITAMSFARNLLGISWSPYLLDVFLSWCYQPDAGGSLYHEIREIAEEAQGNVIAE